MTFLSAESSVESSKPREGIEIRHGLIRHLIATGSRNIDFGGNTFTAQTAARDSVKVTAATDDSELCIHLPTSHAFVQRWIAGPPGEVTVKLWRQQPDESVEEQYWSGVVQRLKIGPDHIAKIYCETRMQAALNRRCPTIGVSTFCQHILYDKNCKVLRGVGYRTVTTVASYDGREVVLASTTFDDNFAKFGELLHVPSGERVAVISQIGTTIELQRPILELRDGDAVHLYAGCDKTIVTCEDKFDNVVNFGGLPELPRGNVFLPDGMGVYQSEPDEE